MDEPELSRAEARGLLNLAGVYRDAGRASDSGRRLRIAVDVAYNAAELWVKALLFLREKTIPQTHGGIVTRFADLYVRQGRIPEALGRDLHLGLERRNKARYDWHAEISEGDPARSVAAARALAESLQSVLSGATRESEP